MFKFQVEAVEAVERFILHLKLITGGAAAIVL